MFKFCESSLRSVRNTADLSTPSCQQPAASYQDYFSKFIFSIHYMSLNYSSIQRYLYCSHFFLFFIICKAAVNIHIYTQRWNFSLVDTYILELLGPTYQIPIQHVRANIQYLNSLQQCEKVHFILYLSKQSILIVFLLANLTIYTYTYAIIFICVHKHIHIFTCI